MMSGLGEVNKPARAFSFKYHTRIGLLQSEPWNKCRKMNHYLHIINIKNHIDLGFSDTEITSY